MAKRKLKKASPVGKRADTSELGKALAGQKKAELVRALLELAHSDRAIHRQLTARFHVDAAPDKLDAATRGPFPKSGHGTGLGIK